MAKRLAPIPIIFYSALNNSSLFKVLLAWFLLIPGFSINAQDSLTAKDTLASGDTVEQPSGLDISSNDIKHTINSEILKDIKTAKALGAIGITTHFVGSFMFYTSQFNRSPGLYYSGFSLNTLGVIPSCIGATLVEDAVGEINQEFPKHRYWRYYGQSWAFWGLNFGINTTMLIIFGNGKGVTSPALPIILSIGSIVSNIAAEIYSGIAVIGPLLYARKAERFTKRRSVKLKFHLIPEYSLNGGKGIKFVCYY